MRMKDIPFRALHKSPFLHSSYVKLRFPVEIQLLHGDRKATSTHPSIIHFSLNRAASQFTKKLLCRCAKDNGLTPVHLNEYARANDLQFLDRMSEDEFASCRHVFKPQGYCYSAFGGFVRGIPDLEQYLIVLMVRDPRDVLTSLYYSTVFSHSIPADPNKAARFMAYRDQVSRMTVDEYVLSQTENYGRRYRRYMDELANKPNVHITKYETMIADFPRWLDELLSFCSLTISADERKKLIDEADKSRNTNEDRTKHRRQVIPGDHCRKLKPDTIDGLNAAFQDVLARYGYA